MHNSNNNPKEMKPILIVSIELGFILRKTERQMVKKNKKKQKRKGEEKLNGNFSFIVHFLVPDCEQRLLPRSAADWKDGESFISVSRVDLIGMNFGGNFCSKWNSASGYVTVIIVFDSRLKKSLHAAYDGKTLISLGPLFSFLFRRLIPRFLQRMSSGGKSKYALGKNTS